MLWYINETYKNGWSRSMVLNQFEFKSYERSLIEPSTTSIVKSDDLTKELFKDTYVFSFLDKEKIKTEKDLKNQMIDNIIIFLQELGPGFSLVGREYKLITPSKKVFYIDLLMYHVKLYSYIVIEVKIGEFEPSDIGQLMFYVNAIDKLEKTDKDNDTIGLILCKDSDNFVAKTTLDKTSLKLGISKYKIIEELPLDSFVLETDSPYLAPEPKRGNKNEPAYVKFIAEKFCEIKNISLEELSKITENNIHDIFDI